MINLNKHIYTGNFAKSLAEQFILMNKVFYRVNGNQALNSHSTGSDPNVESMHHQGSIA